MPSSDWTGSNIRSQNKCRRGSPPEYFKNCGSPQHLKIPDHLKEVSAVMEGKGMPLAKDWMPDARAAALSLEGKTSSGGRLEGV
jgi:hypothetical protein